MRPGKCPSCVFYFVHFVSVCSKRIEPGISQMTQVHVLLKNRTFAFSRLVLGAIGLFVLIAERSTTIKHLSEMDLGVVFEADLAVGLIGFKDLGQLLHQGSIVRMSFSWDV